MSISDWTVDQVADFIDGLQLHTLTPRFRENAVDGSDLLGLTDEELRDELGCSGLQAKKIRSTLEQLGAAAPAPDAAAAATPTAPAAAAPPPPAVAAPVAYPPVNTNTVQGSVAPLAPAVGYSAGTAGGPAAAAGRPALSPEQLTRLREVVAKLQQLEADAPDAKAAQQQQLVSQLATQTTARQAGVASAELAVRESEGKVAQYTGDGFSIRKALVGKKKATEHAEKLQAAQAQLAQAQQAEATSREALAQAQSHLAALSARVAELGGLRQERESLKAKVLVARQGQDPELGQLQAQAIRLRPEHQQALQWARAYSEAHKCLQEAATLLKTTMQTLQRGQGTAGLGMAMGVGRAARGVGRGTRAPLPMMMAQSMNFNKANRDVQIAAQHVQRAQQLVPGGEIPFIQPATVRNGMGGMFVNMMGAGVAGGVVNMAAFKQSMAGVQQMFGEVQQALGWVGPKASGVQQQAAQLGAQLQGVDQRRVAQEEALLRQELERAT